MWFYEEHNEDDYIDAIERVEEIAVELGAQYALARHERFTTCLGDKTIIEDIDINVYTYNGEYFEVESHYLSECPYIVLSFGNSPESILDDAVPFPYNLSDEELIQEVKYSLGIEPYPED